MSIHIKLRYLNWATLLRGAIYDKLVAALALIVVSVLFLFFNDASCEDNQPEVAKFESRLNSFNPRERESAIKGLSGDLLSQPEYLASLIKCFLHKEQYTRSLCRDRLAEISSLSRPLLLSSLKSEHGIVVSESIATLAQLNGKSSAEIALIKSFLKSGDERVRASAAGYLGEARDGQSVNELILLVEFDVSNKARIKAIQALSSIGFPAKVALPKLGEIRKNSKDLEITSELNVAINSINSSSTEFPEFLRIPAEYLGTMCLRILDQFGSEVFSFILLLFTISYVLLRPALGSYIKAQSGEENMLPWRCGLGGGLPMSIKLDGSILSGIITTFWSLYLLVPTIFFCCATVKHGYSSVSGMFMPLLPLTFLLAVLALFLYGINFFVYEISCIINHSQVMFSRTTVFGKSAWTNRLSEYTIESTINDVGNNKSLFRKKLFCIILKHVNPKFNVTVWIAGRAEDQNISSLNNKTIQLKSLFKLQ